MFSLDAALLMAAYAELAADEGVRGDSLEIGVHRGLSAILTAALRADGGCFVAIDLFQELQHLNVSRSGLGDQEEFLLHMTAFYGDTQFLRVIAAPSSTLTPDDLGKTYSFCHIDGGHSPEETYGDLKLCSDILLPGGVLVIDDYFNPYFPGVCEGAVEFMLKHPHRLIPLAIGFNKVVFQAAGLRNLNEPFSRRFPRFEHAMASLWQEPVFVFGSGLTPFVDFERSIPGRIVARDDVRLQVVLEPQANAIKALARQIVQVPVLVRNTSEIPLTTPIFLSYHLLSRTGDTLAHDNSRFHFREPLCHGEQTTIALAVACPTSAGEYELEIDLVWEGVCWFKERGNHAPRVPLTVT